MVLIGFLLLYNPFFETKRGYPCQSVGSKLWNSGRELTLAARGGEHSRYPYNYLVIECLPFFIQIEQHHFDGIVTIISG